jgi:hypothetical protein
MNVSSVTEVTLGLHRIHDAVIDWSPTEVNEDDNVRLACEGMQTACEAKYMEYFEWPINFGYE